MNASMPNCLKTARKMSDHHVRFGGAAASDPVAEKQISSERIGPGIISVNLGFLQINHRYHITFTIPKSICDIPDLVPKEPKCACIIYSIMEFSEGKDSYKFILDFKARKENILEEIMTLHTEDDGIEMKIILHATVIGKGKGTPMVRKGVHSVEIVPDPDESDE